MSESCDKPEAGLEGARAWFLGVPLDLLTRAQTMERVERAMRTRTRVQHVVVNVAKIVNARRNDLLRRDIVESDIVNVDGMGVVWGARALGIAVPERVTGIDLMDDVLTLCARHGFRPYVFGATQPVLKQAVARMQERWPALEFAGWRDGYFSPRDEPGIVAEIKQSGADCLLVAISSPVKENFIHRYRDELGVPFLMGVGGSIDVMAGAITRAPRWVQRAGLEWLYRVVQEPRRMWKRYLLTNTRFAVLMIAEVLRGQGGQAKLNRRG